MDMVRHTQPYFSEPRELPGGFWEHIKPLAEWIIDNLKIAWQSGYSMGQVCGRLDAQRDAYKRKQAGKAALADTPS